MQSYLFVGHALAGVALERSDFLVTDRQWTSALESKVSPLGPGRRPRRGDPISPVVCVARVSQLEGPNLPYRHHIHYHTRTEAGHAVFNISDDGWSPRGESRGAFALEKLAERGRLPLALRAVLYKKFIDARDEADTASGYTQLQGARVCALSVDYAVRTAKSNWGSCACSKISNLRISAALVPSADGPSSTSRPRQ